MYAEAFKSKRTALVTILGAVLLLVGLLGFVNNPVLGIFRVDALHNLIHILSGLFLLGYGARNFASAKRASLILGIVYAIVTVLGFLTITADMQKLLGLVTMNPNDNYLHLLLTLVFLAIGLL